MNETSNKTTGCEQECAWKRRFEQLAGFLARQRKVELAKGTLASGYRASTLEGAYYYASGIAEVAGLVLPDLEP